MVVIPTELVMPKADFSRERAEDRLAGILDLDPISAVLVDRGDAWVVRAVFVQKEPVEDETGEGGEDVAVDSVTPAPASTAGRLVVEAARAMIDGDVRGDHCWDWANAVYERAGVRPKRAFPADRYVHSFDGKDFKATPFFSPVQNEALMDALQPGDWVFVNNRNRFDRNGNHSAIFMGWAGRPKATLAQLPSGPRRPPGLRAYDLADMPLTHVSQPIRTAASIRASRPPAPQPADTAQPAPPADPGAARDPDERLPIGEMDYSAQMEAIGKTFESFQPRRHTPAGETGTVTHTIGYGHLMTPEEHATGIIRIDGRPVDISGGITEEQASSLFRQDRLRHRARFVPSPVPPETPAAQHEFDGLLSFVLNTGGFRMPTLYAAVVEGRWDRVAAFVRSNGRTNLSGEELPGLVARREFEADIIAFGESRGDYKVNGRRTAVTGLSYDKRRN